MDLIKTQPNSSFALSDGEQFTDMVFCQHEQLFFFASSNGDIRVKSMDSTRKVNEVWGTHTGGVKYLLSMPDKYKKVDKIISIGNDSSVWVWQVGSKELQLLKVLHGYQSVFKPGLVASWPEPVPNSAEPPPLLHFLVFVSPDGALNWWDLDSYTTHTILIDGMGAITAMDFDEYEDLLAFGTAGGEIRVYRLSTLSCVMVTSTKGIVNNLRFRAIRKLDPGASRTIRRLAIASSYDTSVNEVEFSSTEQLGKPLNQWEYPFSNGVVSDLWPVDEDKVVVAFKNGSSDLLGLNDKPRALDTGVSGSDNTTIASVVVHSGGRLIVGNAFPRGHFSIKLGVSVEGLNTAKDSLIRPLRGLPTVGVKANAGSIFPMVVEDIFVGKNATSQAPQLSLEKITEATKILTDKLLAL